MHPEVQRRALEHATLTDGYFANPGSEQYWAAFVQLNPWAVSIRAKIKRFTRRRKLDVLTVYGLGEGVKRILQYNLPNCRVNYINLPPAKLKTRIPKTEKERFDLVLTNFYDCETGFDQSVANHIRKHGLLRKDGLLIILRPDGENNLQFEINNQGNTERTLTE